MSFKDYLTDGEWDDFMFDEEEENTMTIDFTKPVYLVACQDSSALFNDLDGAIKKAATSAKMDRDGDDYFVMQAIKRVATPRPEATITDMPVA